MARIAYPDPSTPDLTGLVERIVAERGELLHLYRMLLHSPSVADGWLALLTAVRQKTSLPAKLREMIIIRIAHLNGAAYEAEQHETIARNEGVSEAQLKALMDWKKEAALFDGAEQAVLELTDQMTRQVHVDPQCWRKVARHCPDNQAVELVITIAAYNMVSRVLAALEITSSDMAGPGA